MKIDWMPSPDTIKKAQRIAELREQGRTFEEIASIFQNHRTYIIALHRWFKEQEKIVGIPPRGVDGQIG